MLILWRCSKLISNRFWIQLPGQSSQYRKQSYVMYIYMCIGLRFMVFNATFNNISVISWRSVLLVEETGENHRLALTVTDKLYHIMLYRANHAWAGFELTTLVLIGTDCIGSYKSNYHTITTAQLILAIMSNLIVHCVIFVIFTVYILQFFNVFLNCFFFTCTLCIHSY